MRAMVLLSGGLDSATCLAMAVEEYGRENVDSCSVHYGQRHSKEEECASAIADHYGVPLHRIDLFGAGIYDGSRCSLLAGSSEPLPSGRYSEQAASGRVSTYVPFRNGLIASAVAALALSVDDGSEWVIRLGAHSDDSAGDVYPDCSEEFVFAMSAALSEGTSGQVSLEAPFAGLHKSDVVAKGALLGVPYHLTWSCYEGGEEACGRCATCIDRRAAFEANGLTDPIPYRTA